MQLRYLTIIGSVLISLFAGRLSAATDTFIESADGKRLVRLESPELDKPFKAVSLEADGKTVVYVHGNEILKDIHDPAILVVDEHDVRPSAAGVKIARFDGDNILHGIGDKVLINYHHPDLCPDAHADRIYKVDGPQLTNAQLVAVLYALKPDMFKLSDAEIAEQKKAMADANAEEERKAAADQVAGQWMMLSSSGPVEKTGKGTITISPKQGAAYPVSFDLTAGDGPNWNGAGVYKEMFGDKLFWVAYGTPKTVAMCVYEIDGGSLKGVWYPWYIKGDAKNTGAENLKGPETLDGDYKIESATAPFTGAAYTGTVTIKPAKIVGADDEQSPYNITWNIGGKQMTGIGIRHKKFLFVASGTGADVNIAAYKLENGSMTGDWYKAGSTEKGSAAITTK